MGKNTSMEDLLTKISESVLSTMIEDQADEIAQKAKEKADALLTNEYGFKPEVHRIQTETKVKDIVAVTHEKFDTVLQVVSLNIPVYLTGKAGTGKNVICKQIAEALGLDFYFTNAVTQEYKLTGFIDANGNYQETQFYKAFTQGGLFFLDEMDASIPEVLIILNAAIANKYFDFPIGKVDAHPDFRVVAAGNTLGTGADEEYTGRYQLDKASLDRFALVYIDYSPKIEMNMANGDRELVEFCHEFRKATEDASINCLFSYRTIDRIAKLAKVMPDRLSEVIDMSLLKGMPMDDLKIILGGLKNTTNRYSKAMYKWYTDKTGEKISKKNKESTPSESAKGDKPIFSFNF